MLYNMMWELRVQVPQIYLGHQVDYELEGGHQVVS